MDSIDSASLPPRMANAPEATEIRLYPNSPLIFTNQTLHSISLLSPSPNPPQVTINIYSTITSEDDRMGVSESSQLNAGTRQISLQQVPQHTQVQTSSNFPPIPSYSESQRAYYPHGVKRLPHFHPPRFSRRLRSLMSQRQKPHCLNLNTSPSHTNPQNNRNHRRWAALMPWSWSTSSASQLPSTIYDSDVSFDSDDEDYRLMRDSRDEERGHRRKASWYSNASLSERGRQGGVLDPRFLAVLTLGLIMTTLGVGAWVLAVRKIS